jgi:aspartate-semialdehyde dehydrogenase
LKTNYDLEEVKQLLAEAPGVMFVDHCAGQQYPLATDIELLA